MKKRLFRVPDFLRTGRDKCSQTLVRAARLLATDVGWSRRCQELGSPNMLSGLSLLADSGFRPSVAIDCGACVGDWTRLFQRVFPDSTVLMIEPQERHAATLRRLCDERAPHLKLACSLVGPPGMKNADFVVLDDAVGTGSSVLPERSGVPRHVVTLPVTTLDQVVAEHRLPLPDFVKLDVQGFELEVLKGAAAALSSADFVLLEVSVTQYNEGSPLFAEVIGWMSAHGYRVCDLFDTARTAGGLLLQIDMLFVRESSHWAEQTSPPAAATEPSRPAGAQPTPATSLRA
jgi:FkbM family methyltransferase